MFRNSVQASKTSNNLELDINNQNCILSVYRPGTATVDYDEEEEEFSDDTKYDILNNVTCLILKTIPMLYYISGFIVKPIDKMMKCTEHSDLLQGDIELPCS